ncbi:MAG: molybdate ABC transporter permease subunit [Candidatus Rifleibacteriota bacterium]
MLVSEYSAVWLSFKVATLCAIVNTIPAIFFGWLLARKEFPGKNLLNGLLHLPLVLPPVTTGYLLLLLFGNNSFIGSAIMKLTGIRLSFSIYAAIIASSIISFPFFTRAVRIAIEMTDEKYEQAAWTLGASKLRSFVTITLPLAFPGILSGFILSFARSFGEFGATITFAGNIAGETRTLPLAIFTNMQVPGQEETVLKLALISIAVSFAALFLSEYFISRKKRKIKKECNCY